MTRRQGVALGAAVACAVVWIAPVAAHASYPSATNGRIVFDALDSSNTTSSIYAINPDGTALQRLTSGSNDLAPDVSADGQHILFSSNRGGSFQIYEMNADGSSVVKLTDDAGNDYYPTISPDGSTVAYRMTTSTNPGDIFTVPTDGSMVSTQVTDNPGLDSVPEWSPDGSTILFHSSQDDPAPTTCSPCVQAVYSIDPDGQNQTRLVYEAGERNRFPNWSPDGTRIVFEHDSSVDGPTDPNTTAEIYTANADGSAPTLFAPTAGASNDEAPDFSPDGTQLVWEANGNLQIAALDAASPTDIATDDLVVGSIDWSVTPTLTLTSATSLTASTSSAVYGQPVAIRARVVNAGGASTAPTGTVTFTVNGTQFGHPIAVNDNGVATLKTTALAVGTDHVVAHYSGDSQHTPTQSRSVTVQVDDASATVTLTPADGATLAHGQPVTATITTDVPSKAKVPNGQYATVTINGSTTGDLQVTNGKVTIPAADLPVGSDTVQVCLQDAPSFEQSCSDTATYDVEPASSVTTLTSSVNPADPGQKVKLTAVVSPKAATGTVTFTDTDGTVLGSAMVAAGKARITVRFTDSGDHQITATYSGDDTDAASTSNQLTEHVN